MHGPREIETKVRVPDRRDLETRLKALGARPGPPQDETNVLYDDAAGRLRAEGCALRVRTVDDRGLLAELGVAKADFLSDSYVALWLAAREKDPSLPADMVFEDPR